MNPVANHQPVHHYVTIAEFCERFGISRAFYYKLRDAGDGPDELRMGSRKVVITIAALAAWEKKRTKTSSS
ncbi:helix-turn-helix transcriptional regulator [Paraburkholderia dipogonis]|uniref:helix-turn-helix transcriptional regulator n=1 Tax=Paraburkholderia dipogonis TaxID=1211383 RepID=UPI0038B9CC38